MEQPPTIELEGVVVQPTIENVRRGLVPSPMAQESLFEVQTPTADLLVLRIPHVKLGHRDHLDLIYGFDGQGEFKKLDRIPDEVYSAVPCPFWRSGNGIPVRCGGPEHDIRNWHAAGQPESR